MALDKKRRSQGMSWKQVAEISGVNASTLTRVSQGKSPSVESMAALAVWSKLSVDSFVQHEVPTEISSDPISKAAAYFRASPNLSPESADIIESVIRSIYDQLREDENPMDKNVLRVQERNINAPNSIKYF